MYRLLCLIIHALSGSLSIDPEENNTVEVELFMKPIENATIFPVSIMRASSNDIKVDGFKEYVNRIKQKGVEIIKDTATQIMWEFNIDKNITNMVDIVMINYEKKIENYANSNYILSELKSPPQAESLYMFLDVLNTAYKHLFKEQTKMFKIVLNETDSTNIAGADNGLSTVTLHSIVFKQCLNFKKKELLHICNNYQVCRPYSAFTRYLMQVLYKILSLTNSEFKAFIKLLNELINNDEDFLTLIAENENNIIKVTDKLFSDPDNIKDSLEVLRSLLNNRYKKVLVPDLKRQRKIQAARVLLDIIDRTLSFGQNKDISFDIDKTINAIKDFAKGLVVRMEEDYIIHISDFINSIFRTLKMSENALVPSLIETLLTSNVAYKGLFQDGSKNVYAGESNIINKI